ncbi:CPBP family glutamic-type intramembrane protease [Deinococcus sp. KNUC1210]|uniref:CPBP family glutamic-type intramembrane protease n=1 Tax=Deinococcus sp. KNUC1210 TaxID=2917691 RepID=UPI001EEFAB37|nr:CPBP family glutamic-type intramembrane protease [Deinococcus sp. KNUC1210]ULH15392.1 CPBP family glutamic-type intramembrane protease [Deinococcus sp. KNUC1210]
MSDTASILPVAEHFEESPLRWRLPWRDFWRLAGLQIGLFVLVVALDLLILSPFKKALHLPRGSFHGGGTFFTLSILAPIREELLCRNALTSTFTALFRQYRGRSLRAFWFCMPVLLTLLGLLTPLPLTRSLMAVILAVSILSLILRLQSPTLALGRRFNFILAVLLTALFALLHLSNYSNLPPNPLILLLVLPQFLSGFLLAYAANRYGLRASMIVHSLQNTLVSLVVWLTLLL